MKKINILSKNIKIKQSLHIPKNVYLCKYKLENFILIHLGHLNLSFVHGLYSSSIFTFILLDVKNYC
jgi:hypothetical protein